MKFHSNHTNAVAPVEQIPGGFRRVLADGDEMMLIEWRMNTGVNVPLHAHPHEQSGYVISGEVLFTVDGVERAVTPGTAYSIPGNLPHSARFEQPSVLIDIFSPPREDYRAMSASAPSYMLGTMQQSRPAAPAKAKPAAAKKKKPAVTKKRVTAKKKPAAKKRS
jgi:quercetin dioxygenase-like cupin family protein